VVKNMDILPSILTGDANEAKRLVQRVWETGKFSRVQVDFVDGEFANNLTIKPKDLDLSLYKGLKFDAHLMVVEKNLEEYVKGATEGGFDRVIVQMESVSEPRKFKGLGWDVHSPIEAIQPFLENLEVIVVMSVEPGFGGQKFVEEAVRHASQLDNLRKLSNLRYKICVDGGVEMNNLEELVKNGVDEVVVGARRVLEW
jgi:ribulose-phosphate 3-epimerase